MFTVIHRLHFLIATIVIVNISFFFFSFWNETLFTVCHIECDYRLIYV